MLLSDRMIKRLCTGPLPMIDPFVDHQVSEVKGKRVISFGLGSYTYDVRMSNYVGKPRFRYDKAAFDPKNFDKDKDFDWYDTRWEPFYLEAGMFCLTSTVETIAVPRNVLVECIGKSTYARCGVTQLVTPLEPEWYGKPTLEIVNNHGRSVILYPGEGICALKFNCTAPDLFYDGSEDEGIELVERVCEVSYGDRNGKYQGDMTVRGPKV